MRGKELNKFINAGRAVRRALEEALEMVERGTPVIEICETLEDEIRGCGAAPAFPVNVSINSVAAHYSSPIGDETVVPNDSLVKVDVGAHVDGYIVDAAVTLAVGRADTRLMKAALDALRAALSLVREGVRLGEIGGAVERAIRGLGYRPIANLGGHKIERYSLHAGKTVPNVRSLGLERMRAGEVYAIEPFATDGEGLVVERDEGYIYRVRSAGRVRGDERLNRVLRDLATRFDGLPFSERWLGMGREEARRILYGLVRARRVHVYPVLIERGGGNVAQFEDTVVVTPEGALTLAGTLELSEAIF